jgi:hypothetical protein
MTAQNMHSLDENSAFPSALMQITTDMYNSVSIERELQQQNEQYESILA